MSTDETAPGKDRAPERRHPVHVLPVVLDPQRVLTDQVALERLNHLIDGARVPPARCLTGADQAGIGGDPHELSAADDQRLDFGDLHLLCLPMVRAGFIASSG